ncbi:hypothetical protein [Arthrobacter sp. NicSoilC5]|uniref:hypothetical protein n=1 Tax=Arthrobacter sp. NicSoilC5 TaxID=2831000 RepID=UPI001CC3D80C|nr:hypothetical protein [Arthrobacter sp. NicSoilC5]BCW78864.1 hypothetical protein NicSoilC5_08830 [Arthrobacter sp. NicSoilC5]
MIKHDEGGFDRMMARLNAESKHPKPDDGKIMEFPGGEMPLVRAGEIYGRAIRYTRTYGLIEWVDEQRNYQVEWLPARQIKRVDKESWSGRPL